MIQEVIDRLTAQAPSLKLIEGAAELAAVKVNPSKAKQPAAYVIPLRQSAKPTAGIRVVQDVTDGFAVMIAQGNLRDRRGREAAKDIAGTRDEIHTALIGWSPITGYTDIELVGGQMISLRDGVAWWESRYKTEFILSS